MTTSEWKGRFFTKRIDSHIESNRIANWNALLPSSAPVERLFSFAGMITRPHRRSLSDKTFEQLLILKANE